MSLQEHIIESTAPEQAEGWRIEDAGGANWALRVLAKAEKELRDNAEQANAEIKRVTDWLKEANKVPSETYERMQMLLEDYHRRLLAEDDDRKTVHLVAGTLKSRKLPDNVAIKDEAAFIAWAKGEREDFVRTKHEVVRQAVKDAVLKDGEVLPGVKRVKGETRFSIEVKP